ncbi:MAG TPA: mycothiol synthase [Ilumatobacteraceae bacterium]
MWRIETRHKLDDAEFDSVKRLVAEAAAHDGFPPLSDQLLIDLERRDAHHFSGVVAFDPPGDLAGYAQLSKANESTEMELVVAPTHRDALEPLMPLLLRAALAAAVADGAGRVYWWVHHPDDGTDAVASAAGLHLARRLLQMRRPLPIEAGTTVDTRAFVVGRDEAEWLRVNNAAFLGHPEQGGWTMETLRLRELEPWFYPAGFRLHERDGRLTAFCWTKVHEEVEPRLGEIYVIGVDPSFHGLGLGKALTIAGLHSLADRGVTVGMLHVDAANTAAMSLYERLGFAVHHEDHAYMAETIRSRPS